MQRPFFLLFFSLSRSFGGRGDNFTLLLLIPLQFHSFTPFIWLSFSLYPRLQFGCIWWLHRIDFSFSGIPACPVLRCSVCLAKGGPTRMGVVQKALYVRLHIIFVVCGKKYRMIFSLFTLLLEQKQRRTRHLFHSLATHTDLCDLMAKTALQRLQQLRIPSPSTTWPITTTPIARIVKIKQKLDSYGPITRDTTTPTD